MLELVLVRHGEAGGNVRKTYMGWSDEELTSNGIRQVERVRECLSGEEFSAVYCSPQKRTLQTARIIYGKLAESNITNKSNNIPRTKITQVDDLRERNFGIFDNLTYDEIKQRYPQEHDEWIAAWIDYRIPSGESAADVYGRVSKFVAKLKKEHSNEKILIVTHKGWIMNAAAYILGMPVEGIWHFHVDPGTITRFEIRDGFPIMKMLNG